MFVLILIISLYALWVIGYLIWERKKMEKLPPEDSPVTPQEEVSPDEIMGKSTFRLGMNEMELSQQEEKPQILSLDSLNQAFKHLSVENEVESPSQEPENEPQQKQMLPDEEQYADEPEEEEEEYQSCTLFASPSAAPDLTPDNINKAFHVVAHPDSSSEKEKAEATEFILAYENSELFRKIIKDRGETVSNLLNQHLTDYYKSSNSSAQRG